MECLLFVTTSNGTEVNKSKIVKIGSLVLLWSLWFYFNYL